MLYISIPEGGCFVETDKEMTEMMRREFSTLNEANRKGVVEMTKFLALTQNNIIPAFLGEKGFVDTSIQEREERRETP
jgi:hypothetical protein